MEQQKQILERLIQIKNSLNALERTEFQFTLTSIESILNRFYDKNPSYSNVLKQIQIKSNQLIIHRNNKETYDRIIKELMAGTNILLDLICKEIELLGLPSNNDVKIDKSTNVTVNQNQSQEQSQTTQISIFLEFIKDDITPKQYRELVELAKTEPDPEKAKPKIFEKLKSFGADVCTNIVTGIITNPDIWSSLLG